MEDMEAMAMETNSLDMGAMEEDTIPNSQWGGIMQLQDMEQWADMEVLSPHNSPLSLLVKVLLCLGGGGFGGGFGSPGFGGGFPMQQKKSFFSASTIGSVVAGMLVYK